MSRLGRWFFISPRTYLAAVLDALVVFAAVLLVGGFVDDDGWRGAIGYASGFAGVRVLINAASIWNGREEPR